MNKQFIITTNREDFKNLYIKNYLELIKLIN